MRDLLWEVQNGRCYCCGRALTPHTRQPSSGDRDTVDHVVPKGLGGPDAPGNLALMAYLCNQRKGQRPPTPAECQALEYINTLLGWPTPSLVLQMT